MPHGALDDTFFVDETRCCETLPSGLKDNFSRGEAWYDSTSNFDVCTEEDILSVAGCAMFKSCPELARDQTNRKIKRLDVDEDRHSFCSGSIYDCHHLLAP